LTAYGLRISILGEIIYDVMIEKGKKKSSHHIILKTQNNNSVFIYMNEDRYLVINNISKKNNIKDLCITASAFDFCILFSNVEIYNKLNIDHLLKVGFKYKSFASLDDIKKFLNEKSVPLIGIEILDISVPIKSWNFELSEFRVSFIPGNEGTGLSSKQKAYCDGFVYIPQYGSGTASLNVNIATSIILNEYNIKRLNFST